MIVLDTSTLILLAKIDLLRLLAEKTRLQIPIEVQLEALAKPELYDARIIAEMIVNGEIQVAKEIEKHQCQQLQKDFGLEVGEASALLLVKKTGVPFGTDDELAIKAAKIMGISFFTAIHVVTELYEKGRLDQKSALTKLERLEKIGRYDLQIIEDARQRIQEKR